MKGNNVFFLKRKVGRSDEGPKITKLIASVRIVVEDIIRKLVQAIQGRILEKHRGKE